MVKKAKEENLLQVYNNELPPNNEDIEMIVLGTILISSEVIYSVASEMNENLFFNLRCREICKSILQLYKNNDPIDILTITQKLRSIEKLEEVTFSFVSQLTSKVASTANFDAHFKILQEYALRRQLIQACSKGVRHSYDETQDVFDLVSEVQNDVDSALKNVITYQISNVGDIHQEILKKSIELVDSDARSGVPTGLRLLDNVTNGWQESDLIILAGRPSMGKTAAAISMAIFPAITQNIGIGIFSLEMSKSQLTSRMQSIISGVNVGRIVKKQLTIDEIIQIDTRARDLNTAPLFIDDTPNISIQEFKGKARKMVREMGCKLIIVDYLQLMRSGMKTNSREHEIAEISRSLKAVAKELNVPVMALSQLSRAVESRGGDKKPLLSDLRESGQIEQDADMVCFCYRPEYYNIDNYEVGNENFNTHGLFLLIVAKHRNGELGEIPLRFLHEQTKLVNYEYSNFEHFEPINFFEKSKEVNVEQTEKSSTFVQEAQIENESNSLSKLSWDKKLFESLEDDETPF
jgi:replicative DNA helicase